MRATYPPRCCPDFPGVGGLVLSADRRSASSVRACVVCPGIWYGLRCAVLPGALDGSRG
uniref:hypothetical protein n=1 Tax=Faecalibacterium prausnitzii TaxID=853 RepID=UPI003FED458B